jgi:hypothetical protein
LIVALNVRVGHRRPVYGYAEVLGWIREDIVVEERVAADLAKMCVGQSHLRWFRCRVDDVVSDLVVGGDDLVPELYGGSYGESTMLVLVVYILRYKKVDQRSYISDWADCSQSVTACMTSSAYAYRR